MISTPLLLLSNSTSDIVPSRRVQRSANYAKSRPCYIPKTRIYDPSNIQKRKTDSVVVCGFLAPFFGERSNEKTESQVDATEDTPDDDKLENGEEIVLFETTQSDGSGASFIYRNGGPIEATAANELCIKNDWPSRPVEKLASALEQSYLIASIWLRINGDQETDRLVAFGRVTSDHACNALIWDVIVDPEYQGRGLGRGLVERIVRTLMMRDITNIAVFADKQVVKFYEKLRFEADPNGIKGMFWCPRGSCI